MMFMNKAREKYIAAFFYIMSLLPIFLPWCYFDKEIDGIKYGTDIVNNMELIVLAGITFFSIIFCKNQRGKILTKILLMMHPAVYLVHGLLWYVPLLTDFNLRLSLEAVHYGFYLSLLCSSLMYLFYVKTGRKDNKNEKINYYGSLE